MNHNSRLRQDRPAFQESGRLESYAGPRNQYQNMGSHLMHEAQKSKRYIDPGIKDHEQGRWQESTHRALEKDKKILRMIFDTITQDGVLNL